MLSTVFASLQRVDAGPLVSRRAIIPTIPARRGVEIGEAKRKFRFIHQSAWYPQNAVTADLIRWGRGTRDGEVVETIEDFAGMKDSWSGLLPDHTVINYNTSSILLAAREASTYMRITLGER